MNQILIQTSRFDPVDNGGNFRVACAKPQTLEATSAKLSSTGDMVVAGCSLTGEVP